MPSSPMPSFHQSHFVLTGTWISRCYPPFHRGRIQAASSQGITCGAAESGLPFRPLVSCPGLSSLHQDHDSNLLRMSYGNSCVKYVLFSRSVYLWLWKDLRDISNFFFSCLKSLWRNDCLGPGKNPKLSLSFPSGMFSGISSLLPIAWMSSYRTLYSVPDRLVMEGTQASEQPEKACEACGLPRLYANWLSDWGRGPQREYFSKVYNYVLVSHGAFK